MTTDDDNTVTNRPLAAALTAFADRAAEPLPGVEELPAPPADFETWQHLIDGAARRTAVSWTSPGPEEKYGTITWLNGRANGALDAALRDGDRETVALALGALLGVRIVLEAISVRTYREGAT